ncbi:hypothetical protein UT300005_07350 [Clostridium sp. CTA-5]
MNLESFALGLIETVGLVAGIEAADIAVKSSNVELIGYENSKGGTVVVKVRGDVGAVKAAVESACTSAKMVNKVLGTSIIPRPNNQLEKMIFNYDNVGLNSLKEKNNKNLDNKNSKKIILETDSRKEYKEEKTNKTEEIRTSEYDYQKIELIKEKNKITCNLCMDPKCSRKKGEPRNSCIHFNDIKK